LLLVSNPAVAETGADEASTRDFDIQGADAASVSGLLHLDDANTALNPFQKLSKSWPEDLVIAPIPAYSPQLGWNLTLGGAYFLASGKENTDVPPSLIGAFAMAAENGSYAYGAGTYLHLLDDKLRIKAGAAHIDIRYRFYGIGNEIDFLDIDILQKGPAYFLTGSWNVWKKLYVGLGYRRGSVDTRVRFDVSTPFFDPSFSIDLGDSQSRSRSTAGITSNSRATDGTSWGRPYCIGNLWEAISRRIPTSSASITTFQCAMRTCLRLAW